MMGFGNWEEANVKTNEMKRKISTVMKTLVSMSKEEVY